MNQPQFPSSFRPISSSEEKKTPQFPSSFTPIEQEKTDESIDFARLAGQVPAAWLTLQTWPGAITTAVGAQEARQELEELEERLPRLKKLFPQAFEKVEESEAMNKPLEEKSFLEKYFPAKPREEFKGIDREKYLKNIELAEETGPTPENFIGIAEDITGLPFRAKTKGQSRFRNFLTISGFGKGTAPHKIHTANKAGAYSAIMQQGGASEEASDITGMILAQFDLPAPRPKERVGGKIEKIEQKQNKERFKDEPPPPEPPINPEETKLGERPYFESLVPEHELLERIEPLLTEELERKIGNPPKLLSLKTEAFGPPPKFKPFELQQSVGKEIAPTAMPNARKGSRAIHAEVNAISEADYKITNKLYDISRADNAVVSEIHPKMIKDLDNLIEEIDLAPSPSNVQKDIRNIAMKVRNKGALKQNKKIVGYKEVGNDSLIAQIQSNNQKIKHDYMQGQPLNAYLHLNTILEDALESTAEKSPEAWESFNRARNSHRQWAQTFKSDELLKWRDPGLTDFSKLLKSIENTDQIKVLDPILNRTKKGKELYDRLVRDYVENKLNPYFENPKKIDSLAYNKTWREMKDILSPEQAAAIDAKLTNAREQFRKYTTAKEVYESAQNSHKQLVKEQDKILTTWKKNAADISKNFPYKSDGSILRDLETVRGLKRLEEYLPKNETGKKLFDDIKDYAAVNLLTQGKINPSAKALPLKKILNDINQRALLEHTLGKSVTKDLREIVNNVPEISKKLSKSNEGLRLMKNVGKLVPGIRGSIATGEALIDMWKILVPAIEGAEYGLVDLDIIRILIENRHELLG